MKIFKVITLLSLLPTINFAQNYTHKSWCSGLDDMQVFKHIKEAADFVEMDPLLLAVGMSSEGFAVKYEDHLAPKCQKWPKFNADKSLEYDNCGEKINIDAMNVYSDEEPWEPTGEKVSDNSFVASEWYYGFSWPDDGTDTFCLELNRFRQEGLFPYDFSIDDLSNLNKYNSLESAPDIICRDDDFRNEPATMRFTEGSMDRPYGERLRVPSDKTKGDKGAVHYKTAEVQTFGNAAMWKDAKKKFETAFEELKESLKDEHPYLENKVFTEDEKVFWTKIFFNGGQGTQAGAFFMLKKYASKDYLKNDDYLTTRPTRSYGILYDNGRHVLDSYKYAKSINCPRSWPTTGKSYRKLSDIERSFEGDSLGPQIDGQDIDR